MSIPNTGMKRRPTHPGGMLRDDFLPDYGLSVSALAEAAGVSRQSINELLRERRALSPEMGLRLGRLFGNANLPLPLSLSLDANCGINMESGNVERVNPWLQNDRNRFESPFKCKTLAAGDSEERLMDLSCPAQERECEAPHSGHGDS